MSGKTQARVGRGGAGFTLVELIVATAILAIIALAIMTMFTGSMRAVKQGNQVIDANDMARAAIQIIERDLDTAFTARDAGEYHQFFGCPVGMMFIGLVRATYDPLDTTTETLQLARVSYLLYRSEDGGLFTDRDDNLFEAYSLVRLVEIGVEDLNTFPGVNWDFWDKDTAEPDGIYLGLNAVRTWCGDNNLTYDETQQMLAAKKRELWLRMLAGWGSATTGDPEDDLPADPWSSIRVHPQADPAALNTFDFVIADNILPYSFYGGDDGCDNDGDGQIDEEDEDRVFYFSFYGGDDGRDNDGDGQIDEADEDRMFYGVNDCRDNDGDLLIDEPGEGVYPWDAYGDINSLPGVMLPDEAFFSYGRMTNNPKHGDPDGPEMYAYWNSVVNSALPTSHDYALGHPLSARLPEVVRINFTFWFESPYVGAADYERTFTQTIEVPSAYTRAANWQ